MLGEVFPLSHPSGWGSCQGPDSAPCWSPHPPSPAPANRWPPHSPARGASPDRSSGRWAGGPESHGVFPLCCHQAGHRVLKHPCVLWLNRSHDPFPKPASCLPGRDPIAHVHWGACFPREAGRTPAPAPLSEKSPWTREDVFWGSACRRAVLEINPVCNRKRRALPHVGCPWLLLPAQGCPLKAGPRLDGFPGLR